MLCRLKKPQNRCYYYKFKYNEFRRVKKEKKWVVREGGWVKGDEWSGGGRGVANVKGVEGV